MKIRPCAVLGCDDCISKRHRHFSEECTRSGLKRDSVPTLFLPQQLLGEVPEESYFTALKNIPAVTLPGNPKSNQDEGFSISEAGPSTEELRLHDRHLLCSTPTSGLIYN